MKKRKMMMVLAAACVLTASCGMNGGGRQETEGSDGERISGAGTADTGSAENGDAGGNGSVAGSPAADGGAAGNSDSGIRQGRSLTEAELAVFTEYVSEADNYGNYGFLLSVYDTPAGIDLGELFYAGAGIRTDPLEGEKEQAYLAATGQDELYTDVTCLTTAQLDAFLQEKTGLTYAQMEKPLEWTYLKDYDLYCSAHGDTNYQKFTCVAGSTVDEKTYTLRFRRDREDMGAEPEPDGYRILDCEAVLEKQGDGYRFLSNRIVTEEDQIADQTFPVTLPEIGDAVFTAYAPGSEMNPQSDVTFMLLYPDGRLLQTLGGSCTDNLRAATESFESLEAVSFPDYNGDGYTDVITIASYSYVQGPDAGNGFYETRIYSGNSYGYFYYEGELSRYVNDTLKDPTVAAVTELLAEGSFYGDWTIAACVGTSDVYGMSQEDIDDRIGSTLTFQRDCYLWTGNGASIHEETWVNGYGLVKVSAQELLKSYQASPESLGFSAGDTLLEIQTVEFGGTLVEPGFFLVDQRTLLIARDGVFFTAVREE